MIFKDLGKFDTLFEDFLLNIALTQTQSSLIDETLSDAISVFMSSYADVDVYTQGSYAMGTIVKPLTANQSKNGVAGEFDVDIVLERENWNSPIESLKETHQILVEGYADKVDKKERESCERVYHSKDSETEVLFHADYVPIKSLFHGAYRYVARRSDNYWANSNTKKLKEWFLEYANDKQFVRALIVILKRIRDYAGLTDILPSICIMAIVYKTYEQTASYAEDLLLTMRKIVEVFSQPYGQIKITIPTVEENLAKKIKAADCNKIRIAFQSCLSTLENEFLCKNKPNLDKIRDYLSDDFPKELSDYPECLESLRSRGFSIELDGSLRLKEIEEDNKNAHLAKSRIWYKYFGKGQKLKFVASNYDKSLYGIRWQVLNADGSSNRRGELFKARGKDGVAGSNSNEFINYETESYDGLHWIKYYIYEKNTKRVVEVGKKFHVEVKL